MTKVSNPASTRLPNSHLNKTLVGRFEALAASVMRRSPEVGERLIDEIARAKLVAPNKMRDDFITIGMDLHRFRSGLLRAILAIKETGYGSDLPV